MIFTVFAQVHAQYIKDDMYLISPLPKTCSEDCQTSIPAIPSLHQRYSSQADNHVIGTKLLNHVKHEARAKPLPDPSHANKKNPPSIPVKLSIAQPCTSGITSILQDGDFCSNKTSETRILDTRTVVLSHSWCHSLYCVQP